MLTQKERLLAAAVHSHSLVAPITFPGKWVHSLAQDFILKSLLATS